MIWTERIRLTVYNTCWHVLFQYVKEFSQKQYLQASEHACKEFRTLVDYLVTKFSYVWFSFFNVFSVFFQLISFTLGSIFKFEEVLIYRYMQLNLPKRSLLFWDHLNVIFFSKVSSLVWLYSFVLETSLGNYHKEIHCCDLNEFLFQNRNVELQKTFMPASLAQVKDYDITSMTHFNLRKITPPKEPRSRADILEYVAKDIIHVSVL